MLATVFMVILLVVWLALPAMAETKKLRIGTGDWAPYVDPARADAGAVARLVKAVFARAGYEVEFVFYPWDRDVLMLQQGQLDAIMPYSCNPERERYALCSDPLVHGEMVFFHRQDQGFDWQQLSDLKRYRIGTTLGYSYGGAFDKAQKTGRLQIEQSGKDDSSFRLLMLGRIDLHPQDRAVGYAMLGRLFPGGEVHAITHHPRPLNTDAMRMLFRKDDARAQTLLRQFNAGLQHFVGNGDLQRLQDALYSGNADNWQPRGGSAKN